MTDTHKHITEIESGTQTQFLDDLGLPLPKKIVPPKFFASNLGLTAKNWLENVLFFMMLKTMYMHLILSEGLPIFEIWQQFPYPMRYREN